MFELDKEIDSWCKIFRHSGSLTEAEIDELKDHLCCEIERQQGNGLPIEQAFTVAIEKLGNTEEIGKAFSISRSYPARLSQLVAGVCMKSSNITFDLYLVCTILFGWILFTWNTFLLESLESDSGSATILISVLYMSVVGAALVASAVRKPRLLLASSVVSFVLLFVFMVRTEYWWFWTQLNAVLCFLCVLFSVFINAKNNKEMVKLGR